MKISRAKVYEPRQRHTYNQGEPEKCLEENVRKQNER